MNLPFIFVLSVLPQGQVEHVATVSIDQCLSAVDTHDVRLAIQEDMTNTDSEARIRLDAVKVAEAAVNEDSTELQKTKAKLLRAEFDLFRLHEQERLRKAEMKMLNDVLKRVETAVTTVAKQKGCSVVVYQRKHEALAPLSFTSKQIIKASPRSLVLEQRDRIDITEEVLTLLSNTTDGQITK